MQAGEYRRALAFAAHTAGAHHDSDAGKALYAQLLDLGGRGEIAARVLKEKPAQFAPYSPESSALPKDARVVSSAILLDGGRTALSRASSLNELLWVRNARGALVSARVLRRLDDADLAVLELERPLDGAALAIAPRNAFPGSPAFAVEYPGVRGRVAGVAAAARRIRRQQGPWHWPAAGTARRAGARRERTPGGARARRQRRPRPASAGFASQEVSRHAPLSKAGPQKIAIDEIYERALAVTVQVIAVP